MYRIREEVEKAIKTLEQNVSWNLPEGGIKAMLEFHHPDILEYLSLPNQGDGFQTLGQKGKKLNDDYLWNLWKDGNPPPPFLLSYAARNH
jgi:hypothetical protein